MQRWSVSWEIQVGLPANPRGWPSLSLSSYWIIQTKSNKSGGKAGYEHLYKNQHRIHGFWIFRTSRGWWLNLRHENQPRVDPVSQTSQQTTNPNTIKACTIYVSGTLPIIMEVENGSLQDRPLPWLWEEGYCVSSTTAKLRMASTPKTTCGCHCPRFGNIFALTLGEQGNASIAWKDICDISSGLVRWNVPTVLGKAAFKFNIRFHNYYKHL